MRSIKKFCLTLSVAILITAITVVSLAAPVTIIDGLGRVVTIEARPERIISLAPSNTEILFALGLEDRVVGVTYLCDYPLAALAKEKVGGFFPPDIERIIVLNPDLILADADYIHAHKFISALEVKGLTVVALKAEDLLGILYNIVLVGRIAGVEREAFTLVAQMHRRIEAVTERVAHLTEEERPNVFWITWADPIWTSGSGTFIHQLILAAGGRNIFGNLDGWIMVTLEALIERDPTVIIGVAYHGVSMPAKWAATEPRLADITARILGRVYIVEASLVERPGPRIVYGLEAIARLLHPELFVRL
ncbi:ABC transporter substrate-binding protein [Candidatus Acetothermia bacterium]|jgi:iron complex transport system substrate-binding protein|nr:ABC transporter substrate-binding protein [Candidatus Acetothermia bacterium]MCI2426946.1 ABC transporter substrate-binding protein [Candidatus Acetothermia bacterium]MCI2428915.1 ABC transporter substrate-binding protein [Candidatus Acetothermia bacterium]